MTVTSNAQADIELQDLLARFTHECAMNIEMLDGFFAALACAPEMTLPSEFFSEIWGGGEMPEQDAFDSDEQFERFTNLVMGLRGSVGVRLYDEEVFLPVLCTQDEHGNHTGNDWVSVSTR